MFRVDAFTARRFAGNPAAVMLLEDFPADALLQDIAAENNLSETAFLVPAAGDYRLRWFTPTTEVGLCGHATLASAAVVMERLQPDRRRVVFETQSGPLTVDQAGAAYVMDFPARQSAPTTAPDGLDQALGVTSIDVFVNAVNYLALLESAAVLRALEPDMELIARVSDAGRHGVIVTAPGDDGYDFVSRYFAPAIGVPEDPVTGAAHCMLAPYWAKRLGKNTLRAFQASRRGGEIVCRVSGERVQLQGSCVFYLEGAAWI